MDELHYKGSCHHCHGEVQTADQGVVYSRAVDKNVVVDIIGEVDTV